MNEVHAQRTYAHYESPSLETATDKFRALLTSIERQVREILEAAQAEAAEITRKAEDRASELLNEASRRTAEAEELKRKLDQTHRKALSRAMKMEGAIEELRRLHGVQQAELERLATAGTNAEAPQDLPIVDQAELFPGTQYEEESAENEVDQPSAPTLPGLTRESRAAALSPNWDDIFRRRVVDMLNSGKSRAEAERILKRFTIGGSYVDILDEVYAKREKELGQRSRRGTRRRISRRKDS
jgi:hypothetical protein